jgi:hypothetical protein
MNSRSLLFVVAVLACLLPCGCRRHQTITAGLPSALEQASEKTGQRVASDISGGSVLFLHAEMSEPLASAMRKGLKRGLGGKLEIEEMGPEQLPNNFPMMTGDAVLAEALKRHSNAAAVISAIGITDTSAGRVPANIPPLYILNWQSPSFYQAILRHPRCRGGMFYTNAPSGPSYQFLPGGS